jgi:hypothetical protein
MGAHTFEHTFGLFRGHLSAGLVEAVERRYPRVRVVNYTEPRGERRGWFAGPNRGEPFDRNMATEVMAFARSSATGRADRAALGLEVE